MDVNTVNPGEPGPVMEFLGRVAYEFEVMQPLIPTYLHLLVSAIFPIWTAAHSSLSRPPSAAPRQRRKSKGKGKGKSTRGEGGFETDDEEDEDSENEDEESHKIESLTPSDAIVFPLLAGATLASLYFILKWLQDPAWLNRVLGVYFSVIGLAFATKFLKDMFSVVRSFVFPRYYSAGGRLWEVDGRNSRYRAVMVGGDKDNKNGNDNGNSSGNSSSAIKSSPFPGWARVIPLPAALSKRVWDLRRRLYTKARLHFHIHGLITVKSSIDILDVASVFVSCAIVAYHGFVTDKPWFLTNFLGFAFCYSSLQYMTPTTAWTGTLVLGALFLYDIYFVFFTPMMVTVATKLDVPIKLLFPRPDGCVLPVGAPEGSAAMEEYLRCLAKKRTMAMLGLGDIVVPGMMLAFALRFDLYLHYLRLAKTASRNNIAKGEGQKPVDDTARKGDADNTREVDGQESKPVYVSARGSWGERFWTRYKLWPGHVRAKTFPTPYFYATIFGYLAGMITTVVVMQVAAHAQPALLYLVPGVLLSLWGTALVRGDLKALWNYNEMPESETDEKKDDKRDDKKAKSQSDEGKEGTSNGTLKGADREHSAEEQKPEDKAGSEEKVDDVSAKNKAAEKKKGCRRLVYLSITLPETGSRDGTTHGDKNLSTTTSSSEQKNESPAGEAVNDDVPKHVSGHHGVNGSLLDQAAGRDDGEPPGKKARRV